MEDQMKKWFVGEALVCLLALSVGFNITTTRGSRLSPGQVTSGAQKVGEGVISSPKPRAAVVYGGFFQLVVDLQKHASELESDGANSDSVRGYVQTEVNLSDNDMAKVNDVAARCVELVAQQDNKALAVIQEFKSQFPGGRIPKGVHLPPPPSELKTLQDERDQIILAAKNELENSVGAAASEKIARFASGLTTIRSTPGDR
jgi:hypothetical protein